MSFLNRKEVLRYNRHFPVIGIKGQEKLKKAKVLCIGAGGLGCPVLQYLAAAGIGRLGIVDGDVVEISNLQRQVLFKEADIGKNKAKVIAKQLQGLNDQVEFKVYDQFLTEKKALDIISQFDVIIDATDNYQARYLINAVTRQLKKPMVSASIYQFDAQISVFNYKKGPCYQCLYPAPPSAKLTPNCAASGVLGVLPGVAGTIQATEVIKIILEKGDVLSGTLLSIDLLSMRFKQFKINKQDCYLHQQVSFSEKEVKPVLQVLNVNQLKNFFDDKKEFCLIDVRELYERELYHIGGLHIPLADLERHIDELDKSVLTIIYCKSGVRSARACQYLLGLGFSNIYNLKGGILAWLDEVEPRIS
ncbi:ThiF family adenylyltransferase [Thiotrichales bacterium 19S11-10]|nr:ThiF family adenylyltransferase [Thiotrichales bacterium 19S11-10]